MADKYRVFKIVGQDLVEITPPQGTEYVIPPEMWPPIGVSEVPGSDGKSYLVRNDAMFTAYQHSQGEFSEFFKALRDECKILSHRCPKCHQVICPPFQQRCPKPKCNFVEMQPGELRDLGWMASPAVITFFAPARFKNQAPYGEGDVFLKDKTGKKAATALPIRVKTTRGMLKPGIFEKGTKVKIVFCDKRRGEILDIFAVSQSELTPKQISKSPLLESDISWGKVAEPDFGPPAEKALSDCRKVVEGLAALSERIKKSPRAQKDLANWLRKVKVKTGGGEFGFVINNGALEVRSVSKPDLVFAVEDPAKLLPWLEKGSALTNLVMEGTLWVNKSELESITRLDRLHRSLRRDNC